MADFQTLYNEAFRLLRDTGKTKYDLTTIKRWINDGERRFCTFTEFSRKKRTSLAMVASTQEYALPSDFIRIIRVFVDGDRISERKAEDTIFDTTQTGKPYWYYIINDNIGFYPTPSASHTITEFYLSIGGGMSDDVDTPIIPAQYHDLLPLWAAYKAALEGDDDRWNKFKAAWDEGLVLARPKMTLRNLGMMDVVVGRDMSSGIEEYDHDLGDY